MEGEEPRLLVEGGVVPPQSKDERQSKGRAERRAARKKASRRVAGRLERSEWRD
jgi:hypothetical protein